MPYAPSTQVEGNIARLHRCGRAGDAADGGGGNMGTLQQNMRAEPAEHMLRQGEPLPACLAVETGLIDQLAREERKTRP